jgi:predicted TIM-barrel fold metal-dependent hydrolase
MKTSARPQPRLVAIVLLIILLVGAWMLCGFSRPYLPPEPLPEARILDLHCHTAGIGAGGSGCFVSEELRKSYKFRLYLKAFGVTEDDLRTRGDRLIIDRISGSVAASQRVNCAVILALDGAVDQNGELDRARTEIYVPNDFVAAEVAKHSNLRWGASVNPYRPDALARLDWAKAHGAVLVKWLPSIQHIDPADKRLVPFYRKLVELQLPLLSHTGTEHSFTQATDELCDPARLRLALQTGVTVIAAHAATTGKFEGERSLDRLARLMVEFPKLYADISSLTQINKAGDLGVVLHRPELRHRLVYGTDYPLINMRVLVSAWYFPHRLTWAQMRAISGLKNPWDRDVALKQALGVPAEIWTNADRIIRRS